jgi:hypothetical protein
MPRLGRLVLPITGPIAQGGRPIQVPSKKKLQAVLGANEFHKTIKWTRGMRKERIAATVVLSMPKKGMTGNSVRAHILARDNNLVFFSKGGSSATYSTNVVSLIAVPKGLVPPTNVG